MLRPEGVVERYNRLNGDLPGNRQIGKPGIQGGIDLVPGTLELHPACRSREAQPLLERENLGDAKGNGSSSSNRRGGGETTSIHTKAIIHSRTYRPRLTAAEN
jgi:hypothetical protein